MKIPEIQNIKINNKTIYYSDNNFIINKVKCVDEESLEDCIKTIMLSNPNVVYEMIQYSKKNNEVIFYTDNNISVKEWYKKNCSLIYNNKDKNFDIFNEIDNILNSEDNNNYDCISLYDYNLFNKENYNSYIQKKNYYEELLNNIIEEKNNDKVYLELNFDYNSEFNKYLLCIGYCSFLYNNDCIYISKKDNDLCILNLDINPEKKEIINAINSELYKIYTDLDKLSYHGKVKNGIKTINSNFNVSISYSNVSLYFENILFSRKFELISYANEKDYDLNFNSINAINMISGKENDIFKKVYIKISDCPKECQKELYNLRKKQLDNKLNVNSTKQNNEINKFKNIEKTKVKELSLFNKFKKILK